MFEKEAEEYSTSSKVDYVNNIAITLVQQAYKDGAEFGYNKAKVEVEDSYRESLCNSELNLASVTEQLEELEKANEWHYVKDELPKEMHEVIICIKDEKRITRAKRIKNDLWTSPREDFSTQEIIAWKDFQLPKEILL